MKIVKAAPAAVTAVLTMAASAAGWAGESPLAGCYKPVHGFATSVCTDGEGCSTQSGIFNIVLRNPQASPDQRTLVINGLFDGTIVAMPNACGGADAQHVLSDRDGVSSIATGADVGCLTGGGDFVNSVEITEILQVREGTGAYANLVPGGTVTLTGKLGLKSGINKFKVTPQPGDEVCFELR